ncbi:MAG: hypothetical protein ACUVSI_06565 [Actinomycetota bacterium]
MTAPDKERPTWPVLLLAFLVLITWAEIGCGGGSPGVKEKVEEATALISSSRELLEDLLHLDQRFNSLGQRYPRIEDTLAEGKSLAQMAQVDVDELESRYSRSRELLQEASESAEAGEYREYALLALEAVETVLEAVRLHRELLTAVHDMLDLVPLAENPDQLSYYVEKIERMGGEITALLQRGAEAAQAADDYAREHGL